MEHSRAFVQGYHQLPPCQVKSTKHQWVFSGMMAPQVADKAISKCLLLSVAPSWSHCLYCQMTALGLGQYHQLKHTTQSKPPYARQVQREGQSLWNTSSQEGTCWVKPIWWVPPHFLDKGQKTVKNAPGTPRCFIAIDSGVHPIKS